MKRFLKDERGKASLLTQWQTWVIIGLIIVAGYFIYRDWERQQGGIGFNTYIMLENGDSIKIDGEYTAYIQPLGIYTPAGQKINSIWQNLYVKPTHSEDATGTVTIRYVSHRITWQKIPSGADTNQASPVWYIFSSFTAPLGQTTEKNYGPHWSTSQFHSPLKPMPDGTYWVNTWMKIKGEYKGQSVEKEPAGGLQIIKKAGTFTIQAGWHGSTSFILG